MKFLADIHIHSYYSRATSKTLNLEHLNKWAQIKGLSVIATGDISHPKWLEEMNEKLEPGPPGLFRLKPEYAAATQSEVPKSCRGDVFFILSGEISNIYKRGGKVRKVHNLVLFPSLESVAVFQNTLDQIGNIRSDGRPILGLDSRDLLQIVLDSDERGVLIPAHIWTPWFSMLGSKSGFDTVVECFGDLSQHIFALETGLSSDPPMNWRLSMLDDYNLVSNSDAHSPAKLAREANVFNTDISYNAIMDALKDKESDEFWGTLEFFPEEGKYHMDGHRKCNCMMVPSDTLLNNGLCPVCGKPATLGVSYRVEELADRLEGEKPDNAKPFASLVPLPEVISEIKGVGPNSKTVQTQYWSLLNELGSELQILMDKPLSDLESAGGPLLAEAIRRIREGKVMPQPGYDGEYGIIRVFKEDEKKEILNQGALFTIEKTERPVKDKPVALKAEIAKETTISKDEGPEYGLNTEQQSAVDHRGTPLIIVAGPGTGKTRTLTHRIASLVTDSGFSPESVLAVTFTHKAAGEMRERLQNLLSENMAAAMHIQTFHAFGADLLRRTKKFHGRTTGFKILDTENDKDFHKKYNAAHGKLTKSLLHNISFLKAQGFSPDSAPEETVKELPENTLPGFRAYEELLVSMNAVDYDDLVSLPLQLLRKQPDLRREWLNELQCIAVDEFQDINQAQYELFCLLAVSAPDVCVIGDPDQAIYGFRGASNQFFDKFKQDFDAVTVRLKRNYRSAQNILNASVQILGKSEAPPQERIWSNISPQVKVTLHTSATDKAEAEFVVHRIEQLIGGTSFFSIDSSRVDDRGLPQDYAFSDMAVLLRSRQLLPAFKEAFERSGIPFTAFDNSKVTDSLAFNRFLDALRLVDGQTTTGPEWYPELLNDLQTIGPDASVSDILLNISPLLEQQADGEEFEQTKNLLMRQSALFGDRLAQFIDNMVLQTQIDTFDDRADKVRLLTLHASKGLEFPVVFIAGCEEDIIPHRIPGQQPDIDEERRLLYVGMTRAQQQLYLTHCKKRLIFGSSKNQSPSRFLAAISSGLLERQTGQYHGKPKTSQMKLF